MISIFKRQVRILLAFLMFVFRTIWPPVLICIILGVFAIAQASPNSSEATEVRNPLNSEVREKRIIESKDTVDTKSFAKGYNYFFNESYEKAAEIFKEKSLQENNELSIYSYYYLGLSLKKNTNYKESIVALTKALSLQPNLKLENEIRLNLGEIAIQNKNIKVAKKFLYPLTKKMRNSGNYFSLLYNLALLEKGLQRKKEFCKWIIQMYSRYSSESKIQHWGEDLRSNIFDGEPTDCEASMGDIKSRIKNLWWTGQDSKAQDEIHKLRERFNSENSDDLDFLQAQFYVQEGEILKAYDLLKIHLDKKKDDIDFLQYFGTLAVRLGKIKEGLDFYKLASLNAKNSPKHRQALYQAALMSYQVQEYQAAEDLFSEFIKVGSKSSQYFEAIWILGWIRYLKGEYTKSIQTLMSLINEKKFKASSSGNLSNDRILFWIAMNYLRLNKVVKARAIFSILAKDKLKGYYSIASYLRMRKIDRSSNSGNKVSAIQESNMGFSESQPYGNRFVVSDFIIPSILKEGEEEPSGEEFLDGRNNFLTKWYSENEDLIEGESTGLEVNSEAQILGLGDNIIGSKSQDLAGSGEVGNRDGLTLEIGNQIEEKLLFRLQRARLLDRLGLNDWAKWELYEIERRTSKPDVLKILMKEYVNLKNFHRSSYIAQTSFAKIRSKQDFESTRMYWEYAYPRAYFQDVEEYSKTFEVPSEFIWSIMRTESQFRVDAISPVGALGLMQIMPITGYRVAKILKEANFQHSELQNARVSIRYGTRYLKRLQKQFDGIIPLVAAAYNAGPHRVNSWLSNFGRLDTDEFIEHIPFVETRNYVKKVISSCHIYSDLYGKRTELVGYLADGVPFSKKIQGGLRENWDDI